MNLTPDYSWNTDYTSQDSLWFDNVVSWESALSAITFDSTGYALLIAANFVNTWISAHPRAAFSDFDLILLNTWPALSASRGFWNAVVLDAYFTVITFAPSLQILLFVDTWSWASLMVYYAPELVLVLADFSLRSDSATSASSAAAMYDAFYDGAYITVAEYLEYALFTVIYLVAVVNVLALGRLFKLGAALNVRAPRLIMFVLATARELRLQSDAALQIFFLVFFYWVAALLTFDDDYEEDIENVDSFLFTTFTLAILFFMYRYSIHLLAFLEASVSSGASVSLILKQFFRDFLNMFTLMLRFFILLFRLNVYDTLDDFYDSYYVYLGDFDEDEFVSFMYVNLFVSWLFSFDADDDGLFTFEYLPDLVFNLYIVFTVLAWKLFLFLLVIVEELARVSLALYITYLIIFEIHAVNASYDEARPFRA